MSLTAHSGSVAWNRTNRIFAQVFPDIGLRVYQNEDRMSMTARLSFENRGVKCYANYEIPEEGIFRADDAEAFVANEAVKFGWKFVVSIPESLVGDHPLVRLYQSKVEPTTPTFGYPEVRVSQEMIQRYRDNGGHRQGNIDTIELNYEGNLEMVDEWHKTIKHGKLEKITDAEAERIMARRIARKAPLPKDPNKVKKPVCVKHDREMEFSPVKGKWQCTIEGCKMVATPAREADDRSVLVGKGEVALRVIESEGKTTVLLVSDDNVALDVTRYTDLTDFLSASGVLSSASTAAEQGTENFSEPAPREIALSLRVGVIGAVALHERYGI